MTTAEDHEKQTELIKMSEERYKYINTTYQRVSAKMYDYNCDIKLKVEKQTFRAHRDVLSEASDYFSAMFGHDMREKEQGEIVLHGISPRGFTMMMEYFYHGHITVDSENIEDVTEAARFFHIEWLLYICCSFLIQHLSIVNYDMVLHLADKYCLGELRGEILTLVCTHFVTLAGESSFLKLSYDLLYQLLSEDHYIEASEGFIVKVVLKWLAHDPEERNPYRAVLLNLIRYPLLSGDELEKLPDSFHKDPDLATFIDRAVAYQLEPCKQCLLTSDDTEVRGSKTSLVLISALDDATQIQYRIPELQSVLAEETDTSFLDSVFEFASVVVLGNFMFVAGGYCRRSWCSSSAFYRYDPRNRSWAQLSPMNRTRVSFSLVASKRGLYAVAGIEHIVEDGSDQELFLNSVEFYDPHENMWSYLPPLPFSCFSIASAVLDDKVEGLDEDNAQLMVKLTLSRYMASVSQYVVKAVSKKEYDRYSKYLNKPQVDRYKEEESRKQEEESRKQESTKRHKTTDSKDEPTHKKHKSEYEHERKRKHEHERAGRSSENDSKRSANGDGRHTKLWLQSNLRVRIVDPNYKKGKYYKVKVVIEDVIDTDSCICRTEDNKVLEGLSQLMVETVIPKTEPGYVLIVDGRHRGQLAEILRKDKKAYIATVQLLNDRDKLLDIGFDNICEYTGNIDLEMDF